MAQRLGKSRVFALVCGNGFWMFAALLAGAMIAIGCGKKPRANPEDGGADDPPVIVQPSQTPLATNSRPAHLPADPNEWPDEKLGEIGNQWAVAMNALSMLADAILRYPNLHGGRNAGMQRGIAGPDICGRADLDLLEFRTAARPFDAADFKLTDYGNPSRFSLSATSMGYPGCPPKNTLIAHIERGTIRFEYPPDLKAAVARAESTESAAFDELRWVEAWNVLRKARRALERYLLDCGTTKPAELEAGEQIRRMAGKLNLDDFAASLRFFPSDAFVLAQFDAKTYQFVLTAGSTGTAKQPREKKTIRLEATRRWWPHASTFVSGANSGDPFGMTGTNPTGTETGTNGGATTMPIGPARVVLSVNGKLADDARWKAGLAFDEAGLREKIAAAMTAKGIAVVPAGQPGNVEIVVTAKLELDTLSEFAGEVLAVKVEISATADSTDRRGRVRTAQSVYRFQARSNDWGKVLDEAYRELATQIANHYASRLAADE